MILVHSSSSMMCLRTWSKNVSKWQVQVGKRLRLELFWGFEAKRRCQSHKLGLHMQRDNPVTHSTCRCLRAQGIPWERKQTLLHWVLHCYKEITAKAFSFETPISNVMFYRKKSDFFFLLLYSIKGFWAFMFILQDFCPCHVDSDFLQKSFFLWRAAQVWKGKSVLSAKKKNRRGRDRGRSGHTVTHV